MLAQDAIRVLTQHDAPTHGSVAVLDAWRGDIIALPMGMMEVEDNPVQQHMLAMDVDDDQVVLVSKSMDSGTTISF